MTPSAHAFTIARLEEAGREIVSVAGEFDARAVPEFDDYFADRLPSTTVVVCLNFATIIDSSALGALIRLNTSIDGRLEVHRPRDFQKSLFTITGLDDLLAITSDCACGNS